MRVPVSGRRGQRGAASLRLGEAAVPADRGLHDDERPPFAHQRQERLVEHAGRGRAESDLDVDAVLAQVRETLAVDERIRILDRGDQSRNPGLDDLRDARSGASNVAARLERAIHRRAARARPGLFERQDFGVRLAGAPVEALSDDHTVAGHDHGPHERIRTRAAAAPRGQKQRAVHVIGVYHVSSNSPFTYSSGENGTRSSMPSPTPT